jgi:UDPglucose--hexose-1-phosphate uridylyltransferase
MIDTRPAQLTETLARHRLTRPDGRLVVTYGSTPAAVDWAVSDAPGSEGTHLRRDALADEWVAVSPRRSGRPGGLIEETELRTACPLCPGGDELPFPYAVAAFENRFPAFSSRAQPRSETAHAVSIGHCEVVSYTSDHDASLVVLSPPEIARLVAALADRTAELWNDERHELVMAFENHGAEVGATLDHPHGQIYAFPFVPPPVARRLDALARHREVRGVCLGCEVTELDATSERVLFADDQLVVAVPFAPRWPYEVHVRMRRHDAQRLSDLTNPERAAFGHALHSVAWRYGQLFGFDLPYMLVVREAPRGAEDWHLSAEFLPPHRDRERLKIRASVETAAGVTILDRLPEEVVAELQTVGAPPPFHLPDVEIVDGLAA